jgi:hypothetical protein
MRNLQNTPPIIIQAKSIGHPIDFKWNKKKIHQLLDPLEGNDELEHALMQINHKAHTGQPLCSNGSTGDIQVTQK